MSAAPYIVRAQGKMVTDQGKITLGFRMVPFFQGVFQKLKWWHHGGKWRQAIRWHHFLQNALQLLQHFSNFSPIFPNFFCICLNHLKINEIDFQRVQNFKIIIIIELIIQKSLTHSINLKMFIGQNRIESLIFMRL